MSTKKHPVRISDNTAWKRIGRPRNGTVIAGYNSRNRKPGATCRVRWDDGKTTIIRRDRITAALRHTGYTLV